MAWPIVVVASGGIPVTETTNGYGVPVSIATNGYGTPVTIVASGGIAASGTGGGLSPAGITGLSFWHRPSKAATVTLNALDVASVADQSPNSRNAAQGTGALQPLYSIASQNGKNGIQFTGANSDALPLTNSLGLIRNKPGFTWMGVIKASPLNTAYYLFTALASDGGLLFNIQINSGGSISANTRRVAADVQSGLFTSALLTADAATFVAVSVNYSTKAVSIQIGATRSAQTAGWTAGALSEDVNHSSAPAYGNVYAPLNGTILESVGVEREMSASEIEAMRLSYFNSEWGLF